MIFRRIPGGFTLAMALTAIFFLSSCNESVDSGTTPDSDVAVKSQVLQIRMTDLPGSDSDLEKVEVDITGIEVHHAEKGWMSIPVEAQKYDLMELQNATSVIIFESPLEIGKYTQIRLHLNESNEVTIEGQSYSLKIPSGEQTGIKLITPFEIKKGKIVEVTLDFDAESSVKLVRDQGFLKPVIKVENIAEYDGAGIVTTDGGYVSSINGDFNLSVPANATSENVLVTMNEVNPATITGVLPASAVLVGRVYDLEPDGYSFATNVTLEIPYSEDVINRLGAEENLYVVTYNEDLEIWEPVPSTVISSANIVQAQLSHFSLYALAMEVAAQIANERWTAEAAGNTVTLVNEQYGRITLSDGTVRAVTKTPVTTITPSVNQYSKRPTLFISLCGFELGSASDIADPNGSGGCNWQGELDVQLLKIPDYQYKHFAVDWDTHASNRTQVDDLADVVKDFLQARQYAWDVVVVGHSRGGIFAHDLTRELVGNSKITNLHTFLLDPTTAPILGDFYPTYKYEAYPTIHYGSLLYDGDLFADVSSLGTESDRDIPGYTNYGRYDYLFSGTTHGEFPWDWIGGTGVQGLNHALADILAVKTPGVFNLDGTTGMEVIRISRPDNFSFEGDIDFSNGNVRVWGELTVGGVPTTIDASFGADGIQVGGAVGLVGATQLVITKDRFVISESRFLTSYYVSIGGGELSATFDISVLRSDITANSDEVYWELQVGNGTISGTVPTDLIFPGASLYADAYDYVGDALESVGDAVIDDPVGTATCVATFGLSC